MRPCRSLVVERLITIVLVTFALSAAAGAQPLRSIPRASAPPSVGDDRKLFLQVIINGFPTGVLSTFIEHRVEGLTVEEVDLEVAGLRSFEAARGADGRIVLGRIPGVVYRVDEVDQRIFISAPDAARVVRTLDARRSRRGDMPAPRADYGAVLNYSLFGATGALSDRDFGRLDTFSGSFDMRVFGPLGTITHAFAAGRTSEDWMDDVVRLRTAWSYSDPRWMVAYRVGDLVSGGLSWTRPVNLGGIQVQRNFELRRDLVTRPLPSFSGSAAVPSTIEVYAESTRVWSAKVAPGPFEAVNLPVVGTSGEARVVLKDSHGRETVETLPFFSSADLLRQGLLDFSAEAGFPRRGIGVTSDDYDDSAFAILSARYGFSNRLTIEVQFEAGDELVNGGMGAVFLLGRYGTASLSAAASAYDNRAGGQASAAVTLRWRDWSLYGRVQRRLGDYDDVASVSARRLLEGHEEDIVPSSVPRTVAQLSLGIPVPFSRAHLRAAYTRIDRDLWDDSEVVSMNYSHQIWPRTTLRASMFKNLKGEKDLGVYAGISISFGNGISASAGYDHRPDGSRATADLMKSEKPVVGDLSWHARVIEGDTPIRTASARYRAPFTRFETTVTQYDDDLRFSASAEGALVYAGGGIFATQRINDAFAVVDAGGSDVEVRHQNRIVGVTDRWGRLLVPNLNSFQASEIAIDPTNLPLDADIPSTKKVIGPAGGAGVIVRFGVSKENAAALVVFVERDGAPVKAGASLRINGTGEVSVIGYDGQAFLRNLSARNVAMIERPNGTTCRAEFGFTPDKGSQVRIDGVVCQ